MVVTQQQDAQTIITLSPNQSATWQQTKWVIIVMVVFVMIIALAWTFVGAWIVLPFAGFEVGLFALLMYKVSRFTYSKQIVTIEKEKVIVEMGIFKRQSRVEVPRHDTDFYYSETENNWELPRIAICHKQSKLVIGEFLNLDDRKVLKDALESAGVILLRNRWWQMS
ncbi:DUF2244 domain-containing protein [Glaciecola petra]|uniref:DUF2244 domain-containing protein n=1 Tax=Glaciecola petra TaxID=3075602 RepID=A0ABU2ZT81_9ALTE|nr:DUF2244 domain-containing protein [Aestuariibacter sp. P117]MDT0594769.1 DUF2244 domain-containing protein [Aestuariibacter sp. P117]